MKTEERKREATRVRVANWRAEQKEILDHEDIDIKEYLGGSKKIIVDRLLLMIKEGKSVRSIEIALKALGELVEKREDMVKVDFTSNDYTRIGMETVEGLRREYQEGGGLCPICGQCKVLCIEPCLDSRREQQQEGAVETLGLST